jgi:hypothetical protein
MKARIDNMDLIVATRDLLKNGLGSSIPVYDAVYPNKNLPAEFVLVKALKQYDDGNVDVDGTVEVCVYARNLRRGDDLSQPNLSRINSLTKEVYPVLYDAEKNGVFYIDIETNLVKDADIGYFYNSLIIKTKSINLKFYN